MNKRYSHEVFTGNATPVQLTVPIQFPRATHPAAFNSKCKAIENTSQLAAKYPPEIYSIDSDTTSSPDLRRFLNCRRITPPLGELKPFSNKTPV